MATLDVTPDRLREAGTTISAARQGMQEAQTEALLSGRGEHMLISTGGFQPGQVAQRYLANKTRGLNAAAGVIGTDYLALSAALSIVADVYTSADHREALEFAFVTPGAEAPAGLPGNVDPDRTIQTVQEEAADRAAFQALKGYGDSDDLTRTYVSQVPPAGLPPGVDSHERSVVETYNSDGELVSTHINHQITRADGSTYYYTESYRDGDYQDPDRSRDWYVGPQPPPFPSLPAPALPE